MEIRACQVFLQLAQTLHFAKTAQVCNLSPSALSRLIQRLEQEVGQPLLQRDNRHVSLTPAGRHFVDYARRTVDQWQQLCSNLNTHHSNLSGEVSVFGSVTASYSMLAQILPLMRESYPGIEIKLRTGDQADGVGRVVAGEEDCAIVARPDKLPHRLKFLSLQSTPLRLIGPHAPSALSRKIDQLLSNNEVPDWSKIPMVVAERGLARERLLARLTSLGVKPNIYAQVAGHEAVVSMASLGFGIALVPELVIQHSPKQETIRILPWLDDLPPFSLGLCAQHQRLDDPLLGALWQCAERTTT